MGSQDNIIGILEEILNGKKCFLRMGRWDDGASKLEGFALKTALIKAVNEKQITILGICLGMQLLFSGSQEGIKAKLTLISGNIKNLILRKYRLIKHKNCVSHTWVGIG